MTVLRTNLTTNPNFETDVSGWTAENGAVLTRDTTSPITGTASAKLTGAGGDVFSTIAVNAGDTVTFSLAYTTAGTITGTPRMYLRMPGATLASTALPLTQATAQRFSVTATAVSSGNAILSVFAGAGAGDVLHFDSVLVEKAATAGTYFDGSTTADSSGWYAWTGTANESTSTQNSYITVVPNPSFTPPRMEVTCTVVPGDVMKTATLNRIVGGVSTPTLSQPAQGFDTQVVEDYLAPYGAPVSYEFITDYINPTGATIWDEVWSSTSAWTPGGSGAFTVSGGKASYAGTSAATLDRSVPSGSYRVTVASLAATGGQIMGATIGFVGQIYIYVDASGNLVIVDYTGGQYVSTATAISASSPITIDFLGTSITVSGTGGSWTSAHRTSTDFSDVNLDARGVSGGTFTVGEIKVSSYLTPTHLDVTSAPATLSSSQAWMVHPGNPSLSVPISSTDGSAIAVRNLGPISQASSTTLHPILGQSLPIATRSGPRFGNTLQVALKARTAAHEAALNGILADGTPLLFRFPPTYDAGFDEGFYSVGTVQRARVAQLKGNHLREFTLDLTQVQQPTLTVQNTGWSWAALAAEFPTWQAVAQAFNTWADVLTNNRKPGY